MDISSGMNYDRKGLNQLIQMILQDEVSKVVVLDKDRFVRFGFELIENLCKFKSVDLEIIDSTEQTEEQEVIEDFIQIMTNFRCRLQGEGVQKMKAVIKEFIEHD